MSWEFWVLLMAMVLAAIVVLEAWIHVRRGK